MAGENQVIQVPLLLFDAYTRDLYDLMASLQTLFERMLKANVKSAVADLKTSFAQITITQRRLTGAIKKITVPPLSIAWTVADVQTLFDCTEEEALGLLNDHHVPDRMIELGWEVLENIGYMNGLKRSAPPPGPEDKSSTNDE